MASSSSFHQIYLRKICNRLKIPIFAIDYRLSPTHKFPVGIHDVISGYLWVI